MTASEQPSADPAEAPLAHVFLHIGTMKTGTSFLQQVLSRNASLLERDGALLVGRGRSTPGAVQDGLSAPNPEQFDQWHHLVRAAQAHTGRAVIVSSELLSFADDDHARWIAESFQPNPVTVIITARDLARLLPSAWQNKIKHSRGWPFDSYVTSVMEGVDEPHGASRSFWHHHDLATIARRWAAAVGPSNVAVIPVPRREAGPDALWERFAAVTGLGEGYDTTQDRRSNLSLGYAETELLRLVNRELKTLIDRESQQRVVQRLLANEVLRPDPTKEASTDRPLLAPEQHEWAVRESRRLADEVAALGVQVFGELDELVPAPMSDEERDRALRASPPEIPDMFVRVVVALIVRLVEASPDGSQRRGKGRVRGAGGEPGERRARRGGRERRRKAAAARGARSPELADGGDDAVGDLEEELRDALELHDEDATATARTSPRASDG